MHRAEIVKVNGFRYMESNIRSTGRCTGDEKDPTQGHGRPRASTAATAREG